MGVHNYRELIAWQLGDKLETEVIRIVDGSRTCRDLRYQGQIFDAASGVPSNISEGFLRYSPAEFARFLDFALSCIGEVETKLHHGIKRKFFAGSECGYAFELCRRCSTATARLKQSQQRGSNRPPPKKPKNK